MGKILITANWNIGENTHDKKTTKTFFDYINNNIVKYVSDNFTKDDIVIIMGNILHKSDLVSSQDMLYLNSVVRELSNLCTVYLIVGANDFHKKNTILEVFEKSNVNIIANTCLINIDNKSILLIPYKASSDASTNYIFTCNEANLSGGIVFTSYTHNLIKDKNKLNIPSPYQINKSDDDKRGFFILDTTNNKIDFIKNKYTPTFRKINIKNESDIDDISKEDLSKSIISVEVDDSLLKKGNIIKEKLNKLIDDKVVTDIRYKKEYISISNLDIEYDTILSGNDDDYDALIYNSISNILDDDEITVYNEEMNKLKTLI